VELRLPTWEGEAPAESRLRRSVALPKQNPNDRNIYAIATLAHPGWGLCDFDFNSRYPI